MATAPLFATVAFTNDADEPVHTFRVPLTETTTVRRLAKDALQRLYQSTPSANKADYVVREVRVGEFKAEIFAHDLVMQVVSIREEKIFLKLSDKVFGNNNSSNSLNQSSTSYSAPGPHLPSTATSLPCSSANPSPPLDFGTVGLPESERSMDLTTATSSRRAWKPTEASPAVEPPPTVRTSTATFVRSPSPARVDTSSARGAAAGASNALRTIHTVNETPQDKPYKVPASRKQEKMPVTSPKKRRQEGEQTTPEAARVVDTGKLTARQVSKLLELKKNDSSSFLGWGDTAHLNFPSNYCSNPDDIVRKRLSNCQKTVAAVDREVFGSISDDDSDERSKINFAQPFETKSLASRQNVTDVDEDVREAVDRPKGWGTEAKKFFDTNYCDDPRKAKLSEAEMNEPVRARRRVELPNVLFS